MRPAGRTSARMCGVQSLKFAWGNPQSQRGPGVVQLREGDAPAANVIVLHRCLVFSAARNLATRGRGPRSRSCSSARSGLGGGRRLPTGGPRHHSVRAPRHLVSLPVWLRGARRGRRGSRCAVRTNNKDHGARKEQRKRGSAELHSAPAASPCAGETSRLAGGHGLGANALSSSSSRKSPRGGHCGLTHPRWTACHREKGAVG